MKIKFLTPIPLVAVFSLLLLLLIGTQAVSLAADCVIPASGPWPSCATNGGVAQVAEAQAQSNCRYGMSITYRDTGSELRRIGIPWMETVASGWYVDFGINGQILDQANYLNQIRVVQDLKTPWAFDDVYDASNYLPTYSTMPGYDKIRSDARERPGGIWIVGNEPDRFKFQDDMHPEIYAQVYHDTYKVLKGVDPTAQVAPAALVQVTPGRLQYLDIVYNTYLELYGEVMPVDVWTAHVYPLAEKQQNGQFGPAGIALGTDPALAILQSSTQPNQCSNPHDNVYCNAEHDSMEVFKTQVRSMRQWMKQHGYQNTPLIITEVGILFPETWEDGEVFRDELGRPFDKARVNQFLKNSAHYLEYGSDRSLGYPQDNYKLVQQWAWYSMYTDAALGAGSNLLIDGWETHEKGSQSALSSTGQVFRREATNQPMIANLIIDQVNSTPANGAMQLSVRIRNNGNVSVESPYTVTFYSDQARTKEIGSKVVQPILYGCATSVDTVTINWKPDREGWQSVWVEVDSAETIRESGEGDNVKQHGVLWSRTLPRLY